MTKTRVACLWMLALGAAACGGKSTPNPTPPTGAAAHWSWAGATGPDHWGELAPEFAACKTGKQQTPLALSTADAAADPALAPLAFAFPPRR